MNRPRGNASAKAAWLAVATSLALANVGVVPGAAASPVSLQDGHGLHVVGVQPLDARLLAVTVSTPALPGTARIRILLPAGYATDPSRRYPVFYLLHGTSGGAEDWTTKGNAEQATAGLPLIVVMPDIALNDGGGGWCTNWYNQGHYGQPQWETFHIDELIPWVDQNLRTIASREGRAIAGLSQGGFCSISYPARYPDLFSIALAYSGAPNIAHDLDSELGSTLIINLTEVTLDGAPPNSMFGDRATEQINWEDHDPDTLAPNLRNTDLFMYFGNGAPGPLDPSPVNPGATPIEALVARDNVEFHDRLISLGIPSHYDAYGPGTHSWPYWDRDLMWSLGPIMDDFAHPPARPRRVNYTVADPEYSVYGWQVVMYRPAMEFSTLANADGKGFSLAGSGTGL
ncbi:MAG: esterase family protein [Chloroflexi bacterium]|nr:MAG: esterase family protein [Chloroflexota bacterium]